MVMLKMQTEIEVKKDARFFSRVVFYRMKFLRDHGVDLEKARQIWREGK